MILTQEEKKLLFKKADPYEVSMYIRELLNSGQNERALEFIEAACKEKRDIIAEIQQKLEDLLDDKKDYAGKMDRVAKIKREQTKLEKETFYLNQFETYYLKITGQSLEKIK